MNFSWYCSRTRLALETRQHCLGYSATHERMNPSFMPKSNASPFIEGVEADTILASQSDFRVVPHDLAGLLPPLLLLLQRP